MRYRHRIALALFIFLAACSTTEKIDGVSRALTELQGLVMKQLPVERAGGSRNGREFYTTQFIMTQDGEFEAAEGQRQVRRAIYRILGEQRPYTLEIEVLAQVRNSNGTYLTVGKDERIARVLRRRLEKALHQRREDRNVIDDFKPF